MPRYVVLLRGINVCGRTRLRWQISGGSRNHSGTPRPADSLPYAARVKRGSNPEPHANRDAYANRDAHANRDTFTEWNPGAGRDTHSHANPSPGPESGLALQAGRTGLVKVPPRYPTLVLAVAA